MGEVVRALEGLRELDNAPNAKTTCSYNGTLRFGVIICQYFVVGVFFLVSAMCFPTFRKWFQLI
jgi:hypothetical protein